MTDNLYRVALVPVLSEQSQHFFNTDLPTEDVTIEGVTVKTGYLQPGAQLSLLGVSDSQSLLEAGATDMTDAIDPAMSLSEFAIAFKYNGVDQVYYHKTETVSGLEVAAQLSAAPHGNYRVLQLNYAGVVQVFSEDKLAMNTIGVSAVGHCNMELGDVQIHFKVTNQEDPAFTDVKVVGYKLNAQRVNYNRRAA